MKRKLIDLTIKFRPNHPVPWVRQYDFNLLDKLLTRICDDNIVGNTNQTLKLLYCLILQITNRLASPSLQIKLYFFLMVNNRTIYRTELHDKVVQNRLEIVVIQTVLNLYTLLYGHR